MRGKPPPQARIHETKDEEIEGGAPPQSAHTQRDKGSTDAVRALKNIIPTCSRHM